MWHSDSCQMLNNSVPAELDQIQQVEQVQQTAKLYSRADIKSRLKMWNTTKWFSVKSNSESGELLVRGGLEQSRSNRPNLNSSTWTWRNTQSKTHHSGSLCFYCPCFEAELLWWWRRYVFGLTESGISGFCGVVSLPCALLSLSGTHSTDSLSRYNEQS